MKFAFSRAVSLDFCLTLLPSQLHSINFFSIWMTSSKRVTIATQINPKRVPHIVCFQLPPDFGQLRSMYCLSEIHFGNHNVLHNDQSTQHINRGGGRFTYCSHIQTLIQWRYELHKFWGFWPKILNFPHLSKEKLSKNNIILDNFFCYKMAADFNWENMFSTANRKETEMLMNIELFPWRSRSEEIKKFQRHFTTSFKIWG